MLEREEDMSSNAISACLLVRVIGERPGRATTYHASDYIQITSFL